MPQTVRVFWSPRNGTSAMNFNWPAINANSVVRITACEYDPKAPPDADGSAKRFVGAAPIQVLNVAPHGPPSDSNHGVTFTLAVNWGSPLNVCTDIEVMDDAPQVVYTEGAISPQH